MSLSMPAMNSFFFLEAIPQISSTFTWKSLVNSLRISILALPFSGSDVTYTIISLLLISTLNLELLGLTKMVRITPFFTSSIFTVLYTQGYWAAQFFVAVQEPS